MNANCHPSRVSRVLTGVAARLADRSNRHGENNQDGMRFDLAASGSSEFEVDLGSIGINVDCVCIEALQYSGNDQTGTSTLRRHRSMIDSAVDRSPPAVNPRGITR